MEHGAEPTSTPPGDPSAEAPAPGASQGEAGADRDLVTLEALERELASLEGELDRVEQAGTPPRTPDGEAAAEPPA